MDDDFSSLEGMEKKTALQGGWLLRAVYFVALSVLAAFIVRKLFKR